MENNYKYICKVNKNYMFDFIGKNIVSSCFDFKTISTYYGTSQIKFNDFYKHFNKKVIKLYENHIFINKTSRNIENIIKIIKNEDMELLSIIKDFSNIDLYDIGIDFDEIRENTPNLAFKRYLEKNFNRKINTSYTSYTSYTNPINNVNITVNDIQQKSSTFKWIDNYKQYFTIGYPSIDDFYTTYAIKFGISKEEFIRKCDKIVSLSKNQNELFGKIINTGNKRRLDIKEEPDKNKPFIMSSY